MQRMNCNRDKYEEWQQLVKEEGIKLGALWDNARLAVAKGSMYPSAKGTLRKCLTWVSCLKGTLLCNHCIYY